MESSDTMISIRSDVQSYNLLLAQSYATIYQANPWVWGELPNSDLVAAVTGHIGRALDLGCGYGKNLNFLLESANQVVGTDLCGEALDLARKRFTKDLDKCRLSLLHGDEDSPSGEFDFILCSGVIVDHLRQRRIHIASRIINRLRHGGILFLTAFGKNDPACGVGELVEDGTYIHEFGFPVHYFSPDELAGLFSDLSIKVLYTLQKTDSFPIPHKHETHVLIASKE